MQKITINLELDFLAKDFLLLQIINEKLGEIGIESNFAVILVEVFRMNLKFLAAEKFNFKEFINLNQNVLKDLHGILKNFENGFQNTLIAKIKYKNIAYLTSIAIFKNIISLYCKEIKLQSSISEPYIKFFNDFFNEENEENSNSKIWNSFSSLALRVIYKNENTDSYYMFEKYIKENPNLDLGRKFLKTNSESCKIKFDLYLINDKENNKILEMGRVLTSLINSNFYNQEEEFYRIFGNANNPLDLLLSAFNYIYIRNTDESFFKEKDIKEKIAASFLSIMEERLQEKFYFKDLLNNLVQNFPDKNYLQASPNMENFKLLSVIIHSAIVIASCNGISNSLTELYFNHDLSKIIDFDSKTENNWLCTEDNGEYVNLNKLGLAKEELEIYSKYMG
jgi:hypothetical protein